MIAILEQHDKSLSADELFNLYLKGQTPDSTTPTPEEDIQAALKELTDAGTITAEGDQYQIKK
jgi:1,6-anhydro-N-acetylmuramate kinase